MRAGLATTWPVDTWYTAVPSMLKMQPVHTHRHENNGTRVTKATRGQRAYPWTLIIINTSYQKLPFGSGDDPDKLIIVIRTLRADSEHE